MAKLSKITIRGFRGIRNEVEFDLHPHNTLHSFVLTGENGRGKSSLVDAIEWFFHDTVSHLRREGCQENAYRHYRLPDNEDAFVKIETTDALVNGDKRLRLVPDANNIAKLRVQWQAKGANLDGHLALSRNENLIIRHAQLKDFINKTKTEKLNAVSGVIGFDIVPQTRDTLTRVKNGLLGDPAYQKANGSITEKVRDILKITEPIVGAISDITGAVIQSAEIMRRQIGGTIEITDIETYRQCVSTLSVEKNNETKQLSLIYRQLQSRVTSATINKDLIDRYHSFVHKTKDLLEKRDVLEKIVLSRLYETGINILEANPDVDSCPLCGADIQHSDLLAHLRSEIEDFAEITQIQESLKNEGEQLRSDIIATLTPFSPASSSVSKIDLANKSVWLGLTSQVIILLGRLANSINEFLQTPCPIEDLTEKEDQVLVNYQIETTTLIEVLQSLIDGLNETEEEKTRTITTVALKGLLDHYERWLNLVKNKQKFDTQIVAMDAILEALELTERNEFNRVLQDISTDVNDFYVRLHPDEGFDQLKLISTSDRGLEFEFNYRGDPITPPGKLMSESHLNTLGLCFFLASVIHYNQQCEFVILDDVVSSVDANHRLALARLLRDEPRLNQRQFIILSHDMYWSELLKRTFPNWVHKKIVNWNYEAGICLEDEKSIRDQINIAFTRGDPIDAGHKVRFLADAIFKDICEDYDIPLPYRQGQANDTRLLGDLITAVQQHFGNNNRFDSNRPPLLDIKNCLWLMNIASHHDPRQLNLSMPDVQIIFRDLDQFENLFKKHHNNCPHSDKRLSWDKRSRAFMPCSKCNDPI